MNVIIFDKTRDGDPTGVGVITVNLKSLPNGINSLSEYAPTVVPLGLDWKIVDDSVLPWEKPRELWRW